MIYYNLNINLNMASKSTTTTISMETLNKLYFQFFQKYVNPNLVKMVTQINQLLQIKNTYQVYKYLEETIKETDIFDNNPLNPSSSPHYYPPKHNNYYPYAMPTTIDPPKSQFTNQNNSMDKTQQNPMSFKNKPSSKRTPSNNSFQQILTKPFDLYKAKSQDETRKLMKAQSINVDYQSDFKIQYSGKKHTTYVPSITSNHRIQHREDILTVKNLKQIVKKLGKVFNQNHSKIQKYNKNNDTNKLYTLNTSTRLQKRQDFKSINGIK